MGKVVARMERKRSAGAAVPDFVSLHPGYDFTALASKRTDGSRLCRPRRRPGWYF
jgi:hypothetical protein